jgi:predicted hydrocarbon binding protein
MTPTPQISGKLLQRFLAIVITEVSEKNLPVILSKANLPVDWAKGENLAKLDEKTAVEAYAGIQQAIRTYYGRGARGILQRIGSKLWEDLLENAPFKEKAQATLIRGLPKNLRNKSTLEMLARLLGAKNEEITVHTLDLNLMVVDNISPSTYLQKDDEPICHVTHGLIREAIFWATAQNPLIEETECKANGGDECAFTITFGE